MMADCAARLADRSAFFAILAPAGAVWTHLSCQMPSGQVQIGQPQDHKAARGVLRKPAIAHFVEAPLAFGDGKDMLHAGAYSRFIAVAQTLGFIDQAAPFDSLVGEVLRLGGMLVKDCFLAGVGAVAVHAVLLAVKRSPSRCLSCTFAAVTPAECTSPVRLSTPMCIFIPKYHWRALRVWCISGSRVFSRFFVDDGALISVASTIVPVPIESPSS